MELDSNSHLERIHDGGANSSLSRRRSLGIFYTSDSIARILANWAIRSATDVVLEPSFGGCSLLRASVARLHALGVQDASKQLFGFDVDADAFGYLGRLDLQNTESRFKLRDFLFESPAASPRANVVIANPPFVSYHRMNSEQRVAIENWRRQSDVPFGRKASLWAYFLVHATSFLAPGGRMAFVLPSAATSADYARPLMSWIASRFESTRLFRLTAPQFLSEGAEERTVLLFAEDFQSQLYDREPPREVVLSDLNQLQLALDRPLYSGCIREIERQSVERAEECLAELSSCGFTQLGTVASVSIGEVLGDTKYFVKSQFEWEALGISSTHLKPILNSALQLDKMKLGRTDSNEVRSLPRLLKPRQVRRGTAVASYLESYPRDLIAANKTFQKRVSWFDPPYDDSALAFASPLVACSPRIVWNSAGISCTNSLYKIKARRRGSVSPLLPLLACTTPFRLAAEVVGRVRGSGALKLEPSDFLQLIVPEFSSRQLAQIDRLALSQHISSLFRKREFDAATQVADGALLLDSQQINADLLRRMQELLVDLRAARSAS